MYPRLRTRWPGRKVALSPGCILESPGRTFKTYLGITPDQLFLNIFKSFPITELNIIFKI